MIIIKNFTEINFLLKLDRQIYLFDQSILNQIIKTIIFEFINTRERNMLIRS